jgi:tetratricopeptide (TPR) repeat protein
MKDWGTAVEYFKRLLEKPLYKTPYLAHNNLGWALYNLSRYDEAKRHYDMAIFLNPKMCLAHNNAGRLFAHTGDTKQALKHFDKAVDLCPNYAEPHYFLGRIHAALSAPKQARKHYTRCAKIAPEAPYGRRCSEAL